MFLDSVRPLILD